VAGKCRIRHFLKYLRVSNIGKAFTENEFEIKIFNDGKQLKVKILASKILL
jgi:hypothetical protein